MRQWKNLRQTDSISLIRTIASLTAPNVADTSKKDQYRRVAQQKKLTFMDGTSFANIIGKEKQAHDKTHNPFFFSTTVLHSVLVLPLHAITVLFFHFPGIDAL